MAVTVTPAPFNAPRATDEELADALRMHIASAAEYKVELERRGVEVDFLMYIAQAPGITVEIYRNEKTIL